jgi:hypothetical protein
MAILKGVFFKILAPMIWLVFFAYAFSIASIQLAKAWKAKNFKMIWLNVWLLFVGVYFLFFGGR